MHQVINGAKYKDRKFYATCNGKLCFSAIWPTYYFRQQDVKSIETKTKLSDIKTKIDSNTNISVQYYTLGELLFGMEANPDEYKNLFQNKIVIAGNFLYDTHSTNVGTMSGPVLLANIYLSLLNKQHIVNIIFILSLILAFTALSYIAWFKKLPQIKFNNRFINSNFITKYLFTEFVIKYIQLIFTYSGLLWIMSLLAIWIYNTPIPLLFPLLILIWINTIKEKRLFHITNFVQKTPKRK
jgi:hypothetical protein